MAFHLFSTPVQCTQCGTVTEDPTVERCPKCGALLKERRAPRRLAGVEERHASFKLLLGAMRFLGIIVLMVGGLIFFSGLGNGRTSAAQTTALLMASIVICVVFFAAAGLFDLLIDMEENTRSSFRLQQQMLEEMRQAGVAVARDDATLVAPVPEEAVAPRVATAAL